MTAETSNARGEWVLVPRVPTEAMKVAALQQAAPLGEIVDWQFDIDDETVDREAVAGIYTAMLAAAPQPPAEAQAVAKLVNRKDSDGGKTTTFIRPTSLGMDLPLGEYPLHLHPPPSAPVGVKTLSEFMAEQEALHPGIHDKVQAATDELRASLAQQPAAPSETVNVLGMPEFDGLLDHIYEYGTAAEGVIEKANAFARAVIARYAPQQPAAVDGAVGTVTRVGSFEVQEHRIELDPEFDESLNNMPEGTVVRLYATPVRDLTQQQLADAAAALAGQHQEPTT